MPKLIYAEQFIAAMTQVSSEKVREDILGTTDLLRDFPELGSNLLPTSIMEAFGPTVRKLATPPFLTIYDYIEEDDTVYVLALIHQRQAR